MSYTMHSSYLTPQDIRALSVNSSPTRIYYGEDHCQFGDLWLPSSTGPYPTLIVIHGGCWKSTIADLNYLNAFSEAFSRYGIATWNIEYRCIDNPGGGWPGTFQDIGKATDHIRKLAEPYSLNLNKIAIIGHSSGGHLALWSAARHRLPKDSILFVENPLPILGVVNLAGPGNLRSFLPLQQLACGESVIEKLLNSSEHHYKETSPYELLPLSVKQILIAGEDDVTVPAELMTEYALHAKELGDELEWIPIKNAAHFEIIAPHTNAWSIVRKKVEELLFN